MIPEKKERNQLIIKLWNEGLRKEEILEKLHEAGYKDLKNAKRLGGVISWLKRKGFIEEKKPDVIMEIETVIRVKCDKCKDLVLTEAPQRGIGILEQYDFKSPWRNALVKMGDGKFGVRCRKCGNIVPADPKITAWGLKGEITHMERRRKEVEKLWDSKQLAEYLGLSISHIRRLLCRGQIPGFKIGGVWRFDPDEIREWLEKDRRPKKVVKV